MASVGLAPVDLINNVITKCKNSGGVLTDEYHSILREHQDHIHDTSTIGDTPFLHACRIGFLECVYDLLSHGDETTYIAALTDEGYNGLHAAAATGKNPELINYLLKIDIEPGFLINQKTHNGTGTDTALTLAVQGGNENAPVVRALLDNYANVNVKVGREVRGANLAPADDATALMLACHTDASKIVSLLLGHQDTDVNAQDVNGNTAAHFAVAKLNAEVVSGLGNRGANFTITNTAGQKPLDCITKIIKVRKTVTIDGKPRSTLVDATADKLAIAGLVGTIIRQQEEATPTEQKVALGLQV